MTLGYTAAYGCGPEPEPEPDQDFSRRGTMSTSRPNKAMDLGEGEEVLDEELALEARYDGDEDKLDDEELELERPDEELVLDAELELELLLLPPPPPPPDWVDDLLVKSPSTKW